MALTQITEKGIKDGEIINADINASAAIAGTKVSPNFGSQNIITTGHGMIGTTTEGFSGADNLTIEDSGHCGITIRSGATSDAQISFSDATSGDGEYAGQIVYDHTDNFMMFRVNGGSEALRINSSGNVGIGTTSPGQQLTMANSGDSKINIKGHGSSTGYFIGMSSATDAQIYNAENGFLQFATNDSERMRIDSSGTILFNTTSESNITNGSAAAFQFLASGQGQSISTTSTGFKYQMRFYNPNGQVGYISTQNSATQFNTSSDYRLKENVTAISDGITRLKTLKPSRFNFKVDKDITVDGFLAHEVSSIVPEAITGTKDEVVTQAMIDAGDYKEGTLNDPIYQGIDQSKLVPLLTAALQEAIAKIEVLETKVAALEAA